MSTLPEREEVHEILSWLTRRSRVERSGIFAAAEPCIRSGDRLVHFDQTRASKRDERGARQTLEWLT